MEKHILVLEDQEDINELVCLNLRELGYRVASCHNGLDGLRQIESRNFDLVVLDIMLPDMDGLAICQRIRGQDMRTPILMLTARKSETDRVLGLEMGADDYLTKPFSVRELQARVRALLRRVSFLTESATDAQSLLRFDALTIDKAKHQVTLGEREVALTAKEFDLLIYLASKPGQVFSREQLLDAVWGYQHAGYEHTVNSHINRLRSKLEKNPSEPDFVKTVWGVGYKFCES